jgi:hypothetical protein
MRSLALPLSLLVLASGCDRGEPAPREVPAPDVAATTPAQPPAPPAWVAFSSEKHGFRTEFPASPKSDTMKVPTALGELEMQVFILEQGTRAYMISVSDNLPTAEPLDVANVLDGARDGAVSNIQGRLVSEKQQTVDQLPARRLEISAGPPESPLRVEAIVILRDRKLYQALMVAPAGEPSRPDAERFLAALRML